MRYGPRPFLDAHSGLHAEIIETVRLPQINAVKGGESIRQFVFLEPRGNDGGRPFLFFIGYVECDLDFLLHVAGFGDGRF